ncbi:unnamed protein product [Phaeothamnion confervicola]
MAMAPQTAATPAPTTSQPALAAAGGFGLNTTARSFVPGGSAAAATAPGIPGVPGKPSAAPSPPPPGGPAVAEAKEAGGSEGKVAQRAFKSQGGPMGAGGHKLAGAGAGAGGLLPSPIPAIVAGTDGGAGTAAKDSGDIAAPALAPAPAPIMAAALAPAATYAPPATFGFGALAEPVPTTIAPGLPSPAPLASQFGQVTAAATTTVTQAAQAVGTPEIVATPAAAPSEGTGTGTVGGVGIFGAGAPSQDHLALKMAQRAQRFAGAPRMMSPQMAALLVQAPAAATPVAALAPAPTAAVTAPPALVGAAAATRADASAPVLRLKRPAPTTEGESGEAPAKTARTDDTDGGGGGGGGCRGSGANGGGGSTGGSSASTEAMEVVDSQPEATSGGSSGVGARNTAEGAEEGKPADGGGSAAGVGGTPSGGGDGTDGSAST